MGQLNLKESNRRLQKSTSSFIKPYNYEIAEIKLIIKERETHKKEDYSCDSSTVITEISADPSNRK